MADKENEPRPMAGEVLPPERKDGRLLRPTTPPGIPFIVQAQYWAARRKLEAYTKTLAAQTAAVRELDAREQATLSLERSLVQMEHLDDLRRTEELKIVDELAALVAASEVREFRTRAVKAQFEAEAIEAERRLAEIKKPPASEPENKRSPGEQAGLDIVRMRKEADELKKTIIECYGGEDKMSDDDRALIDNVEVGLRNRIAERIGDL